MNKEAFFKELYNLYGPVTRARNCFLYTKKGIRLTDMYQENGRAIIGWEGGSAFTHLKNVLCRGQVGSFICEDYSRLTKAVSSLLASNRTLAFFSSKMDALKAGLQIAPNNTAVYTPWNPESASCAQVDALIITPPLPWTESIYILAVRDELLGESEMQFAGRISLPFAVQAGITRAIYNLIEALQVREEKDWFIYDPVLIKYWERKGPYLFPKISADKYDDFVLHCLKLGIVINPDYNEKSIIPFGADRGVFTKLANTPFEY